MNIADRVSWLRRHSETGSGRGSSSPGDGEEREDDPVQDGDARHRRRFSNRVLRGVIGFQELKLAREASCALCGRGLKPGEDAYLGVRDRKGPRVILGEECLPWTKDAAEPAGETDGSTEEKAVPSEEATEKET